MKYNILIEREINESISITLTMRLLTKIETKY